jgi:hypothetical protein
MDRGTTRIVSTTAAGAPGRSPSAYGAISASGGYVVFMSRSSDVVGRSDWAYAVVSNPR